MRVPAVPTTDLVPIFGYLALGLYPLHTRPTQGPDACEAPPWLAHTYLEELL